MLLWSRRGTILIISPTLMYYMIFVEVIRMLLSCWMVG